MSAAYFVRPIRQMFDFSGLTGCAEYFTYTVTSFLVSSFVTLVLIANTTFACQPNTVDKYFVIQFRTQPFSFHELRVLFALRAVAPATLLGEAKCL